MDCARVSALKVGCRTASTERENNQRAHDASSTYYCFEYAQPPADGRVPGGHEAEAAGEVAVHGGPSDALYRPRQRHVHVVHLIVASMLISSFVMLICRWWNFAFDFDVAIAAIYL